MHRQRVTCAVPVVVTKDSLGTDNPAGLDLFKRRYNRGPDPENRNTAMNPYSTNPDLILPNKELSEGTPMFYYGDDVNQVKSDYLHAYACNRVHPNRTDTIAAFAGVVIDTLPTTGLTNGQDDHEVVSVQAAGVVSMNVLITRDVEIFYGAPVYFRRMKSVTNDDYELPIITTRRPPRPGSEEDPWNTGGINNVDNLKEGEVDVQIGTLHHCNVSADPTTPVRVEVRLIPGIEILRDNIAPFAISATAEFGAAFTNEATTASGTDVIAEVVESAVEAADAAADTILIRNALKERNKRKRKPRRKQTDRRATEAAFTSETPEPVPPLQEISTPAPEPEEAPEPDETDSPSKRAKRSAVHSSMYGGE